MHIPASSDTRASLARVNVVGVSGCGKSTFARRLAEILGHPRIEMDILHWKANWEACQDPEFFAKVEAATAGERWVLDGNYDRTQAIKWKEVTAVIWLDYPFWLTFFRALKRAFHRAITGQELWPGTGNRESFYRSLCSKDSVLLWTIQSYPRMKDRYLDRMVDPRYSHIHFVRLKSPRAARRYLASLEKLIKL